MANNPIINWGYLFGMFANDATLENWEENIKESMFY
jgi:hypothetical protein